MGVTSVRSIGPDHAPHQIVEVTMINSARRNVLGAAMLDELSRVLADAGANGCRALILRAEAGVNTWSGGHDITELPTGGQDPAAWINPLEAVLRQIQEAPFPVIAAVEGGAWGGACDLVMTSDMVVATSTATFTITPARLGIPYSSEGTRRFVSALPLHIAKEMFFTAQPISAKDAYRWGVVNRLVDTSEELATTAWDLAKQIASLAPLAIAAIKSEITAMGDVNVANTDFADQVNARRRAAWRSNDYREGLVAFIERRTPDFRGQ